MPALTPEYLKSIGSCWSPAKLAESAATWPQDANWTWMLGPRLAELSRVDALVRIQTGLQAAYEQDLRIPGVKRLGELLRWAKSAPKAHVLQLSAALGALLDAPTGEGLSAAVAAVLALAPESDTQPW